MSYIRITLTPELEQTLSLLQLRYPTLNRVELIKLSVSEAFRQVREEGTSRSTSILEFLRTNKDKNKDVDEDKLMGEINEVIAEVREEKYEEGNSSRH